MLLAFKGDAMIERSKPPRRSFVGRALALWAVTILGVAASAGVALALLAQPPGFAKSVDGCGFVDTSDCTLLEEDPGVDDVKSLWGSIDCARQSRVKSIDGYRRLSVIDGDDFLGERCELGRNEHRNGSGGGDGTFQVYREGERKITAMSIRLPKSLPLYDDNWTWQVITQMKQAQPADAAGGTPVLALHAAYGRWRLFQSSPGDPGSESDTRELWSAPAQHDVWTRVAFDITYSQDPSKGRIQMFVDANGDGDATDPGESSKPINTYTLKRETATDPGAETAEEAVSEGESIPSHLRIGPYHDEALDCPPPGGCAVEYDDIQVLQP